MDSSAYERKIASRFAGFDQDGNGYISREDFAAAAAAVLREFDVTARSSAGQSLYGAAEAFWQGMAGMADHDGDQRITREEFVHGAVKRLRDNPDGFAEIARPFLRAVVAIADADADGSVTTGETERVLRALGVDEDTRATAAAALDGDGDGVVSEQELLTAFAAYYTTPAPETADDATANHH
ncbi:MULTISPECIES: EF-hand domain-containing protein [Streptomyces]|uniref:EF-hand domain-containing protein n=1 Tax=Streptomyces lycii TaxID=2654337 RepID=A0ABQ7F906_9ACTN|nr:MULTISPECIES: EF-hand domain-containing protein [Streptomyces]KAF4405117.1 EF-hand domain-containing protein [Streptomyces lycii]PGH48951.1 calcium-binding protein [Streptomyces sp. Ru87]